MAFQVRDEDAWRGSVSKSEGDCWIVDTIGFWNQEESPMDWVWSLNKMRSTMLQGF